MDLIDCFPSSAHQLSLQQDTNFQENHLNLTNEAFWKACADIPLNQPLTTSSPWKQVKQKWNFTSMNLDCEERRLAAAESSSAWNGKS